MDPTIILGIILAAPVVLFFILKVNASLVFLSTCLGAVLVEFVARDAGALLSSTSGSTFGMSNNLPPVNLILQLLPVVITTVLMIHSVKGGAKSFLNIFSAIAAAALLALLVVPLLGDGLTVPLKSTELWQQLENLQTMVIGFGTLLALLSLSMLRPKRHSEEV